jgi:glycosyltransferase involved in cell wall biosynthesis
VKEQVNAISALGAECDYYLVHGKGAIGYLKEIPSLRKKIRKYQPDIIHAHYGLSGLLANLSTRRIPVVVTYHGSDINVAKTRKFSRLAIALAKWNIFVSQRTMDIVHGAKRKNCSLIPCGVDLTEDQLVSRDEARKVLGWKPSDKKVLFAGMYMDDVKGPDLAKASVALLPDVDIMEMRGYNREEVNRLMCAVDCLLMASKTEGSPQAIKEAMACGCPIVSTDVGDVKERISGVDGCYIVNSRDQKEVAEAIQKAFAHMGKTTGREKILRDGLSNQQIATRIIEIYKDILSKNQ